jgi:hypothetical protein
MLRSLVLLTAILLGSLSARADSLINPTVPATGAKLNSDVIRNNFLAARSDVLNILGNYAGIAAPSSPINLQTWVDTTSSPVYTFKYWNLQNRVWVPYATLNINTNAYASFATPGAFLATAPLIVNVSGGITTYGLARDTNFAVNGSNQLALAPVNSGNLLANCTGGSAEPGPCTWSQFADVVVGATNGFLPYRSGGAWGSISTGTSGATLPMNNSANVFSSMQSIITNTSTLPVADSGTLLALGSVDGTPTRVELTSAGANPVVTGRSALGTIAVPQTLVSGTLMMSFNAHGYDGAAWATTANGAFRVYAEGTWSNTSHPTEVCDSTTPTGSTTIVDVLCTHQSGGVTLGAVADQGAGTLNLIGSLYNNGVAPTGTGGYARAASPTFTGTLGAAAVSISGALTYGGVTLAASTTGTGSLVASIAPTITGHPTIEGVTSTGATGTGGFVFSAAPTLTGHPTIEGVTSTGATGTGNFVFGTSPSIATPTVTGSFTATGLVTYADMATAAIATQANYFAGAASTLVPANQIYQPEITVTFSATPTFDFFTFNNAAITLTGNVTTQTLSNVTAGKDGSITFIQDATGSRTTVWNSVFKFSGGVTPALSTAANAVDVLIYHCRSATNCVASLFKDAR